MAIPVPQTLGDTKQIVPPCHNNGKHRGGDTACAGRRLLSALRLSQCHRSWRFSFVEMTTKALVRTTPVRRDLERGENLVDQGRPGREPKDNILNLMTNMLINVGMTAISWTSLTHCASTATLALPEPTDGVRHGRSVRLGNVLALEWRH